MSQEEFLRALVASKDGVFCERCKCCEMCWERCDSCAGEGSVFDDFDDDGGGSAACDTCEGEGGWYLCDCDEHGRHAKRRVPKEKDRG